jgi:hypothetical protein
MQPQLIIIILYYLFLVSNKNFIKNQKIAQPDIYIQEKKAAKRSEWSLIIQGKCQIQKPTNTSTVCSNIREEGRFTYIYNIYIYRENRREETYISIIRWLIHPFACAFELPRTNFLLHPCSCFFSLALIAELPNGSSTRSCLPFPDHHEKPMVNNNPGHRFKTQEQYKNTRANWQYA